MNLTSLSKTPQEFQGEILDLLRSFHGSIGAEILRRKREGQLPGLHDLYIEYSTYNFLIRTIEAIRIVDPKEISK